ncbi:helix-turn-helix domain-containing protein [Sediminibacillus dalangtanensis]|uniref:Helix-turn-helix domain-containing protein n=2 Tax=Sediminibacillus dalangtanensis TaxID=2729421 RepID=A0ABX7VX17_9BACI|nr:helix-turn-helix domain-containing protein [Sediminibacillus dalangtanensis]
MTQEELADLAGFSRSYYTEIETGKRNISLLNIRRLAEALDIPIKDLFDFPSE